MKYYNRVLLAGLGVVLSLGILVVVIFNSRSSEIGRIPQSQRAQVASLLSPYYNITANYKFDEGSGSVANSLVIVGASQVRGHTIRLINNSWVDGRFGGEAVSFSGSNSYAVMPDWSSSGGSPMTVAFWMSAIVPTTVATLTTGDATPTTDFIILESTSDFTQSNGVNGGIIVRYHASSGTCPSNSIEVAVKGDVGYNTKCYSYPGQGWHHYAFIFDRGQNASNEITVYIDGQVASSLSQPHANDNNFSGISGGPLYFMSRAGLTKFMKGTIDDLYMFNGPLSTSEVQSLYQGKPWTNWLPPVISNVQAQNITETGATITWKTDKRVMDDLVRYGLTTSYDKQATGSDSATFEHSVTLTNLTPNTTYHYQVSEELEDYRSGDYTFKTSSNISSAPPVISSFISSVATLGSPLTVTWSSTNVTSCILTGPGKNELFSGYYGPIQASGQITIPPLSNSDISYLPVTLTLSCTNPSGTVTKSLTIESYNTTTKPLTPANFVATVVSPTQINLSWTASPGAITGYKIYRGLTPTNLVMITNVTNSTTFQNSTLLPSTTYYYAVSAYSGSVESAKSNIITATTNSNTFTINQSVKTTQANINVRATPSTSGTILNQTLPLGTAGWVAQTNITGNLITYALTATAGVNGTITPSTATVSQGSSKTFTITPNTGYQLSTLTDNGVNVTSSVSNNTYTISNIQARHTIVATFTQMGAGVTYTVKKDGTGNFTTIQACADVVKAGETCVVYPGTYQEHVLTKSGGTSSNAGACAPVTGAYPNYKVGSQSLCNEKRVTFKAEGNVTMRGFEIRHPFVTVEGFDITGYSDNYLGHITVMPAGNNCAVIKNTIRDGAQNVYGILMYQSGSSSANNCVFRDNKVYNLSFHYLSINGIGHAFERNIFEDLNGWDAIRLFGSGHYFYRNEFRRGAAKAGLGNHPDWVQAFSDNGGESYNIVFEENWVQDIQSQLGQMNSGGGIVDPKLSLRFHDFYFKGNVFANVSNNMNVGVPGMKYVNNTFYRLAYTQDGIVYGGSLTRGDASNSLLKNNAFIAGGLQPNTADFGGYYSLSGAELSKEVLAAYVTKEDLHTAYPYPIAKSVLDDVSAHGYTNPNGVPTAKAKLLTSISQFTIGSVSESYKTLLYEALKRTSDLDTSIRSTFVRDYNFVAGPAPTFSAKRADRCANAVPEGFCEPNGVNGGDPKLRNINDPLGPDGRAFTDDDGLRPLGGSPLCGRGEGGSDIGAYRCNGSTLPEIPTGTPSVDCADSSIRCVDDTPGSTQEYQSIQSCANVALPGDTCLVFPGNYPEHVETVRSGTSAQKIRFLARYKAQDRSTTDSLRAVTKGFRIKHPNISIEGFDITKYDVGLDQAHIVVEAPADNCNISENIIRDGIYLTSYAYYFDAQTKTITNPAGGFIAAGFRPGVTIYIGSNINNWIKNHDRIKTIKSVTDTKLTVVDTDTLETEGPVNSTLYVNKAEKNGVGGIMLISSSQIGAPDFCTIKGNLFSNLAGRGISIHGTHNTITENTFVRMNGWRMISLYGSNNLFSRNIFKDSPRWPGFEAPLPGTKFSVGSGSWDMYDTFLTSTGQIDGEVSDNIFEYNFIKDIDAQFATVEETAPGRTIGLENKGLILRNNVFIGMEMIGSFTRPETFVVNNTFYKNAYKSIHNLVVGKSVAGNPVGSSILNNAFVESGWSVNPEIGGWYSIMGDNSLPTLGVTANYNFVSGPASQGFPAKSGFAGTEANGINGGNPKFQNINNPLGQDGIPFTADDGLIPLSGSPLCIGGENGKYIGAYPCAGAN
jgi:hypothetical protein